MAAWIRAAAVLGAVLLLTACLVTPGKFESALDIRASGHFTFSYKGEVIASDMGPTGGGGAATDSSGIGDDMFDQPPKSDDSSYMTALLWQEDKAPAEERFDSKNAAEDEKKMQAVAAALTKEKGFRSARYLGNRKFEIDYAIEGQLDHAFLFPFNIDAQIVLPFLAVEMRGEDRVRVKAPGFANSFDKSQGPAMGGPSEDAAKALDGTFTLTTDAEIVSQNEEGGVQDVPQGKRMIWRVTSLTSEAPTATLRLRR